MNGSIPEGTGSGTPAGTREALERLQAELADGRHNFSRLVHSSPVGISISRAATGQFIDVNDEFLRILGLRREETIGRTSFELDLWVEEEQRAAIMREAHRTGRFDPRPIPMRRRDGQIVTVLFSGSFLRQGEETLAVAWVVDITERLRAEEALRASERRWRTLLEKTPVVILTVDRSGTILSLNRSAAGRSRAEMLGKCIHDFALGDEARRCSVDSLARVFETGEAVGFEIDVRGAAGARLRMRNLFAPIVSEGRVETVIGVGMDVTPQAEALDALRASDARWRSLMENAPAVIMLLDGEGTVVNINRTVTGRDVEQVKGTSILTVLPPEFRARAKEAIASAIRDGVKVSHRAPVCGPDGKLHWFDSRVGPVGAAGEVPLAVCVAVEVTQQVLAEEAQRESEQRFRDIVQAMGDWVCETGADGKIAYCSPQVEAVLGYTAEEMLGRTLRDTCVPGERRFLEVWEETARRAARPVRDRQVWHVHKDGHRVCLSVSATPVHGSDGAFRGYRSVIHDVTANKQEEQERRRMEAEVHQARRVESLGVLAGGIAHDFNNLLSAILGNAELALVGLAPDAELRPLLEQIQAAGQHAAGLTRQMLAYAGRGQFATGHLDLSTAVREMEQLLVASVPKKVELSFELAEGLPAVEADAAQLRQVVMNLVINAADASGERGGRVVVRTGRTETAPPLRADLALGSVEAGAQTVFCEVEDTGGGIDPAAMTRIFDPFFTTKFAGRGLGLAAVQGIVLRHRGAIAVRSDQGVGAAFRVLFPVSAPAAADGGQAAAGPGLVPAPAALPSRAAWRGVSVLVVDDEESVRQMSFRMLRALGFTVLVAKDGREALETVAAHPEVRAVLLDLTMPRMDGRETFQELRRGRADLPVILCSGYDVLEQEERFTGLDFSGFLQKPFRLHDLAASLQRALDR